MSKYININKLKKHFRKGITPLLCALTVFNLVGINVNASNVYIPFNKPYIDENRGIVVIHRYGGYAPTVFYWVVEPFGSVGDALENVIPNDKQLLSYPHGVFLNLSKGSVTEAFTLDIDFYFPQGALVSVYAYSLTSGQIEVLASETIRSSLINTGIPGTTPGDGYYSFSRAANFCDSIYVNGGYFSHNFDDFLSYGVTTDLSVTWKTDNQSLTETNEILNDIKNSIGADSSSGSISNVSQSEINSVDSKEQALVGSNVSTSDLNVSINPQASSVVWNLVDNAVTGNSKVFAMFISILTIGIIGLILNR